MNNPGKEGHQILEFYWASPMMPTEAWNTVIFSVNSYNNHDKIILLLSICQDIKAEPVDQKETKEITKDPLRH